MIRTRNLQMLATEMFKVLQNMSPLIFIEILHWQDINYNLRINTKFKMPNVKYIFHERESIL